MLTTVEDYIKEGLTHSIHTSQRRSFRGCRRRHDWIFNQFYYPAVTAKPLEFGVAFHAALEVFYNPDTWDDKETSAALALVTFKQKCEEQKKAFLEHNFELGD